MASHAGITSALPNTLSTSLRDLKKGPKLQPKFLGTFPPNFPPCFVPDLSKLAHPDPSWAHLGPSWAHLEPSWAHLGPSWAQLGPSWAHLGTNLGISWAKLGPSWAKLRQTSISNNSPIKIASILAPHWDRSGWLCSHSTETFPRRVGSNSRLTEPCPVRGRLLPLPAWPENGFLGQKGLQYCGLCFKKGRKACRLGSHGVPITFILR